MTAPATPPEDPVPSLEEFAKFVGAENDDTKTVALTRDLAAAVELLDDFCKNPYKPIPPATMRRWYLKVGAEMFDENNGPSQYTDRFENVVSARSSRDPMNVVIREVRRFVSFI
ncbi:hypothetical protein [Rhodococcoides fascians]|uniref:hypothetical protein n=1 Tax=Rhodococcoides fascians TaxID=1828 RepID=UPI001D607B2E|nr:hypothetical protein [Rhodococcus fascians]CAH0318640.1 hypothetical protein SRABI91_05290 [Rhodococcus fascians]